MRPNSHLVQERVCFVISNGPHRATHTSSIALLSVGDDRLASAESTEFRSGGRREHAARSARSAAESRQRCLVASRVPATCSRACGDEERGRRRKRSRSLIPACMELITVSPIIVLPNFLSRKGLVWIETDDIFGCRDLLGSRTLYRVRSDVN